LSVSVRISHCAPTNPVPTWPSLFCSMLRVRLSKTAARLSGGTMPK